MIIGGGFIFIPELFIQFIEEIESFIFISSEQTAHPTEKHIHTAWYCIPASAIAMSSIDYSIIVQWKLW